MLGVATGAYATEAPCLMTFELKGHVLEP